MEKKVNLFLVGAMKAGTTSFVELLTSHPDIYVPPIKEPHYFVNELPEFIYNPSRFFNIDNYFRNDFPKPLHIARIKNQQHYRKLYSESQDQKYLLDASTAYLACPGTASRILEYNVDARIIILLRDPLDRMKSHYKMQKGLSREIRSFEEVICLEIDKFNRDELHWASYIGMSLYTEQVRSYRDKFSKVLVLYLQDLVDSPEKVVSDVADFLEITPFNDSSLVRSNVSRKLRFEYIFYVMRKIGLKDIFSKVLGSRFKQWLFRVVSSGRVESPELLSGTKERLNHIFKEATI